MNVLKRSRRLLQNGNLSRVIELVLGDTVEQMIEVIGFAGDDGMQPRFGQSRHTTNQSVMRLLRCRDRFPPGSFGWEGHGRKVLLARQLSLVPGQAAKRSAVPGSNVQQKLPDAVHAR